MADLTPLPSYMRSLIRQNLAWWKALAELIDNGFDAGATFVQVEIHNDRLTVFDNGRGVVDVNALARLGAHIEGEDTKIGIYGIGCKDAWMSCSDVMEVLSQRGLFRTSVRFDIVDIMKNSWQGPDPVIVECEEKPFTRLTFPLRGDRAIPDKTVITKLAEVFSPALTAGKQIRFVRNSGAIDLRPIQFPELTDRVVDSFEVAGKGVHIDIGLCRTPLNSGLPFWLIFGHRLLEETTLGTGSYSTSGLAGRITLASEWKSSLTKNKEGLAIDCDELDDAIFQRIEPLLKQSAENGEIFESEMMLQSLEDFVNTAVSKVGKAKRPNRGGKIGTVKSSGTGSRHQEANTVTPTPTRDVVERGNPKSRSRRGVRVKWYSNDESDAPIGRYDASASCVLLNTSHPFVSEARVDGSRLTMYAAVAAVLADYQIRRPDGNPVLSCTYDSFVAVFGALVSSIDIITQKQEV